MSEPNHYVDNALLYETFVDWYAAIEAAESEGREPPEMPAYVTEAILAIPRRLATKGNFSGYSYKEDMIADAIENSIRYVRNFNPAKSKNPFSYFTQISYYAFLRRIGLEKKQAYIKHKTILNSDIYNSSTIDAHDADGEFEIPALAQLQQNLNPDLEALFERKRLKAVKQRSTHQFSIEDLMAELNEDSATE